MFICNFLSSQVVILVLFFLLKAIISSLLSALQNPVLVCGEDPSKPKHGLPVDVGQADGEVADAD